MASSKAENIRRLKSIVSRFSRVKVLVIGDLMWDEYLKGECDRISPEAPVPVIRLKKQERIPGGATNVLKNLYDLKVPVGIMGVVGADKNGREMIKELHRWNLTTIDIWESEDRPTTIKTRIVARNQQLLRMDKEETGNITETLENRLIQNLEKHIHKYDAVILSDYAKGLLSINLISKIIDTCWENNVITVADPQIRNFSAYRGATVMTPNEKEACEGAHMPFPEKQSDIKKIGEKIMKEMDLQHLLITRSERGIALFTKSHPPVYVPTVAREVFDVSGAGDTVSAVFTAALAGGASALDATLLANIAGGIVVGKLGTASVTRKEILAHLSPESIKV